MSTNIPLGWKQVRVFTKTFNEQWYFEILDKLVRPFSEYFPESPFWFSRYVQTRHQQDEDIGDTDIDKLPAEFLSPQNQHFSLRFRFSQHQGEEALVRDLISCGQFWHSSVLDHSVLGEWGGDRFCSSTKLSDRLRRTELLVRLFHCNSLVALDGIRGDAGAFSFEENKHAQNPGYEVPFVSILHILNQPYGDQSGKQIRLFLANPVNGQITWSI